MKYLKAGMLVEFEDGILGVVLDDETVRDRATVYKQDGTIEIAVVSDVKVLATAPKQDDKLFYRVAYTLGLTVKSKQSGRFLEASTVTNDVVLFASNSKQSLEIAYPNSDEVKKELEQLVKEQKHLAGLQEDLAKRIEEVKAKL